MTFSSPSLPVQPTQLAASLSATDLKQIKQWDTPERIKGGLPLGSPLFVNSDGFLARLYPYEMARKYNNRGNLSIHNVFKLSSLDW
jgi:hypothetical protein